MWDERYGTEDFAYGTEPNGFVKEAAPQIGSASKVLCIGEGWIHHDLPYLNSCICLLLLL